MPVSQKDIKLLWGRAGSRCSICKCELSLDSISENASHLVGEQAHIIGEKPNAPRGDSSLELAARNSYHNLILLCPSHHAEIDRNVADWPVERLYYVKSTHELWVKDALSSSGDAPRRADEAIVTSVVDLAVRVLDMENWSDWLHGVLPPFNRLPVEISDNLIQYLDKVAATIWPDDSDELRRAAIHLGASLDEVIDIFMRHAELRGDYYREVKFYKIGWNVNYKEDLEKYKNWLEEFRDAFVVATKAANWFADIVRRDINPMFLAEKGRFFLSEVHSDPKVIESRVPLYTDEQIAGLMAG